MPIFDFLKSRHSFESQVKKFTAFEVIEKDKSKIIEFSGSTTTESVKALLALLHSYKIAFSLYDALYPSPSDPGAYITYSQEQNESENTWSMTLGNHGWTGGIYTIEDENIAAQISNLVRKKLLNSIRIDNVKIFSHYDKMGLDANREKTALIFQLHNDIE